MINRVLESKAEITKDENRDSMGEPIALEYFLLENKIHEFPELFESKIYGIEIVKKMKDQIIEMNSFRDISSYREKTKDLIHMLAKHKVTPISLPEILEDVIGL